MTGAVKRTRISLSLLLNTGTYAEHSVGKLARTSIGKGTDTVYYFVQ